MVSAGRFLWVMDRRCDALEIIDVASGGRVNTVLLNDSQRVPDAGSGAQASGRSRRSRQRQRLTPAARLAHGALGRRFFGPPSRTSGQNARRGEARVEARRLQVMELQQLVIGGAARI